MTHVTFFSSAGEQLATLTLASDQSVMQAAVQTGLDGIEAECGGCLVCATCHVYVLQTEGQPLPAPADDELAMLDFVAAERKPQSRLSCQLVGTPALLSLHVQLPERQIA